MTDEGIIIEYEAFLASNGGTLKSCPKCKMKTHDNHCMSCTDGEGNPLPITGDTLLDTAISMAEKDENIDFHELVTGSKFVPVEPGETDG